MATRREELGEPPTPEELLDYRDGRLDEAERRRIEAKLGAFPDAARALADLAAFPDVRAAEEVEEISDQEVSARWQSFRRRLEGADQEHLPTQIAVGVDSPVSAEPAARWWPAFPRWATASLAFGLGLAVGVLVVRDSPPATAVNVTIAQLAPETAARERAASRATVEIAESTEAWVLVLGIIDGLDADAYSATMGDPQGTEGSTGHGLVPTPAGTFHLAFPRDFLPPGDYRIVLHGHQADATEDLAVYSFRLIGG